jgi:hypothetical protein
MIPIITALILGAASHDDGVAISDLAFALHNPIFGHETQVTCSTLFLHYV